MAKNNGNEFNNSKFYNASFYEGNNSRNYFQKNNAMNNVQSASEQTKGQIDSVVSDTLKAYEDMYFKGDKSLVGLHAGYLTKIRANELQHYRTLTDTRGGNGSILAEYNKMYTALEQRHQQYLDKIGGPNIEVPGQSTSSNNATTFASEVTMLSIKDTLDKISENLKYSGGVSGTSQDTTTSLKSIREDTANMTKEQREQSRKYQEVASRTLDVYRSLSSNMVQGKTNTQLLGGISSTLSSFIQGGPYAALFTAVMEIASAVTQFFGQAIGEHWQTMEESFNNYGLYVHRWNDQYAGYTKDILTKQDELYALNLQDNVKVTDWMKKQVELASKGFSADRAEEAALQDLILNRIAPNLDTSSNIFMDLQQRGMQEIIQSLGGIVESVRNISGNSRISQLALGTMVDKLGPVELYAKKNLLTGDAAAALAALESMGMATEDAINIVSTISGVVAHPGQAVTGGSIIERLLGIALTSGEVNLENAIPELIAKYFGYGDIFGGGVPGGAASPMLLDILSSVTGMSGLNAYADWSELNENFSEYFELYKDTAQEPKSAYQDLYDTFEDGFFQTADQRLEILANNSELAAGANGFLHQIAEWTLGIYEEITRITDKLFGRSDADIDAKKYYNQVMSDTSLSEVEKTLKLQEYLGSHTGYSDEMANKFISSMYTAEDAKDVDDYYKETLKKYDTAAYQKAVAQDVAWETEKWKQLQAEASGLPLPGDASSFYNSAVNAGKVVSPDTLKSDRIKVYNDTLTTDLLEMGIANVILPGAGPGIVAGVNTYNAATGTNTTGVRYSSILGFATGGYVDRPTLSVIGEGSDPELVTPVPQLIAAVARGIDYSSKMNTDYTPIINSMNTNTALIIQAIQGLNSRNAGRYLDRSTGLIGNGAVSLEPRMSSR